MTKSELLDAVASKAGATKADTERVLDAFFDLRHGVHQDRASKWPGRASASSTPPSALPATVANPQDRTKTVKVPATTAAKFTPSSTLKAELNPKRS